MKMLSPGVAAVGLDFDVGKKSNALYRVVGGVARPNAGPVLDLPFLRT